MIRRLISWTVGREIWRLCGFAGMMPFLECAFAGGHSAACHAALKGCDQCPIMRFAVDIQTAVVSGRNGVAADTAVKMRRIRQGKKGGSR